jgi:Heparinase II/III-like protein
MPGANADAGLPAGLAHGDQAPGPAGTGTPLGEPGPACRSERSAPAHNTVEIDGADSAEVWSAFREAGNDEREWPSGRPRHRRRWSLACDGLRIDDLVTGRGWHEILIRWPLSADATARVTNDTAVITSAAGAFLVTVEASGPVALAVETRPVATGSADIADVPVLTCRMNANLPAGATTRWSRAYGDGAEETT